MGDLLFLIGLVFFRLGGFKQKSQNLILSSLLPVFGEGKPISSAGSHHY